MENDASINPNAQPLHTAESEKLSVKSLMSTPSSKEETIVQDESPTRAKRTRKSNTESASPSTTGTGTALSSIPHVAKFIECNQDNEEFLKLLHRLLYGTVGLQRQRKASILAFNGHTASEAQGAAAERLAKCTQENLKVLAQVFNLAVEAGAEAISAFLGKPEAVGESIVQPYTLDSINAAVATPLRPQRASAVRNGSASAVGTRSATRRSYQENSDSEAVESEPEQRSKRSSGTPLRNKRMKAVGESELSVEASVEASATSVAEPAVESCTASVVEPAVEASATSVVEGNAESCTASVVEKTAQPSTELLL